MKTRILELLDDVFDIQKNAPLFYKYLMETEAYQQSRAYRKRKNEFLSQSNQYVKKYNSDYEIPYAVSIPLSQEPVDFNDSITKALFDRRSTRKFRKKMLSFEELSFFLLLSVGIKNSKDPASKRMYPSGGSLYSTRVYVDVRNVTGLAKGVYLFNPFKETLELINEDIDLKMRMALQNNSEDERAVEDSCAHILISTRPQITTQKYGELALRLVLIEMGHIGQNMIMIGNGMGLAGFPTCTLNFKISEKMLRTDMNGEFVLYSYVLGFAE